MRINILLLLSMSFFHVIGQDVVRINIGEKSSPLDAEVVITLKHRFQHYNSSLNSNGNTYDRSIDSPKSVNILDKKKKFYIHSLEGYITSVYSLEDFTRIKQINHTFNSENQELFDQTYFFDYPFRTKSKELNYFKGKPVEGCFSHEGKYLWVTYYRRSYDKNAIDPSALCVIDTEKDSIVKVFPTAALPKMISCSPDNKTIAVTHWGDNTVALIDVSSPNYSDFKYKKNIIIDYKPKLNFDSKKRINRDQNCSRCLRGTVFTPDSKYALVGKMGSNSIAVITIDSCEYIGSVKGMKNNIRHILIKDENLYLSINKSGYVQKTQLDNFIMHVENDIANSYYNWEEVFVGIGARTIGIDPTGKYIFTAVNNESKIVIVRTEDMKIVASCSADSYPVGLDVSNDGKYVIVTSQGRSSGGGNSVMIFEVDYKNIISE